MSNYSSLNLEQSLAHTEADALETLSAAKDLLRPLRRLRSAAEKGNVTEIEGSIAAAQAALAELQRQLDETNKGWDFDAQRYLTRGGYVQEVLATAMKAGVKLVERDDRLSCYPSSIRVSPGEKALYINRRRERRIRPSVFVHLLKEQQDRPLSVRPDAFLAALYRAYCQTVAERFNTSGASAPIIPLVDIHRLLTSLPGHAKYYSRQKFVLDIYLLHRKGVDTTEQGAKVSFPISRGVKGKTLTIIDETGEERRYYGIRFSPPIINGLTAGYPPNTPGAGLPFGGNGSV